MVDSKNRLYYNLVETMNDRFNPDGENCIALAIDRVVVFFGLPLDDKIIVKKIKNINDIIRYLKEKRLHIDGFYHKVFLFNPCYWKLFYREKFKSFNRCNVDIENSKCAFLYFTSGNELYGVKEFWNHVVVEFFDKRRIYYDGYIPIVHRNYSGLEFEEPSHEDFRSKIASICLVIRSE